MRSWVHYADDDDDDDDFAREIKIEKMKVEKRKTEALSEMVVIQFLHTYTSRSIFSQSSGNHLQMLCYP